MSSIKSTVPEWEQKLPWRHWINWVPFKIDALGLVTLLGAEEVNSSIGRMVASRWLEYFPLLGAYVIANESFKEKLPSYNLYNLTDGINTTDLSFWFTRWLAEQELEVTRSIVRFEAADKPRSWFKWQVVSAGLSFVFVGFLVVMTILIGDWYGFANALAMIGSILARAYSMQAHRNAIDRAVERGITAAQKDPTSPFNTDKKVLMILADSKAVTLSLPGYLIIPVFSHDPEPKHKWMYHLIRYFGWVVFGVHIVTIGMASLLPQLYTVALMVIPTVLICWKLGCDDSQWKPKFDRRILRREDREEEYECWFGTRLKATVSQWPVDFEFEKTPSGWTRQPYDKKMSPSARSRRRQDLYAWLNLTSDEETSMGKWDLLPHVRNGNESWWRTYQEKKALIALNPLDTTRGRTNSNMTTANGNTVAAAAANTNGSATTTTTDHGDPGKTSATPTVGLVTENLPGAPSSTVLTSSGNVIASPITPTTETGAAFLRAGLMGLAHSGLDTNRFAAHARRVDSHGSSHSQRRR